MSLTFESARLEALVESARMLQGANDVDQLLQHLLRSAMAHVLARRGFVARIEPRAVGRGVTALGGGRTTMEDKLEAQRKATMDRQPRTLDALISLY